MRKRITGHDAPTAPQATAGWLDLEPIAQVELTSEERGYPIETALRAQAGPGWRAETPGPQSIRLIFDRPLALRRIRLVFEEPSLQRTQEFTLRWAPAGGRPEQEILRQQYTFSPPDTAREVEEYQVDLADAAALVLQIIPEIGGGPARASLASLQLA